MTMRVHILSIFFGATLALSPARATDKPPSTERPVLKIDSIIATVRGRDLIVQATGAVGSGGWKMAHLRVAKPADPRSADPHVIVVEFVATPPLPGSAVFQGLVPIAADARMRMHKGVVTVRATTETNEITTQILH